MTGISAFWRAAWRSVFAVSAAFFAFNAQAQDVPTVRAAMLQSGTVNWELDVIRRHGFDAANGFRLEVQPVAGRSAAAVAFQSGAADVIVSDWLWVSRQRAAGKDYVFIPYSLAVGALMVPGDSPITTLEGLAGERVGVAGGPVDKSWLIFQAFAAERGFDLKGETEQAFGAPPLIFNAARSGDVAAMINFWHFGAKAEAAGFRALLTVAEAAEALGLDPETPLLGYVVRGDWAAENPEVAAGFAAASRQAKALLAEDDAEWEILRPMMRAADDAQFIALRDGWRAGIPGEGAVDQEAAAAMFALMAELGGEDLVGESMTLSEGVFLDLDD